MKNIFTSFFVLLSFYCIGQYSGSKETAVQKPIGLNGKPVDGRTYFHDLVNWTYRDYQSKAEILAWLPTALNRTGNFSIMLHIGGVLTNGVFVGGTQDEYWFKNGVADANLVFKNAVDTFNTIATKANLQTSIANGNGISVTSFGAVGDGITDNTTAFQNAIGYGALHHIPVMVPNGKFLTSVLTVASNLNLVGIDSNSVILKNPLDPSHDPKLFRCSEHEDYENISIKNLKLDGNVVYSNHLYSINSPIKDSNSVLISLNRVYNSTLDNIYLNGCETALFLFAVDNINVKNCIFTNIGSAAIQTNYVQNVTHITLDNNRFLTFGCRDHWDVLGNNVRFGEDAYQGGGSNWKVLNSYFFNGAKTKWAATESHFTSDVLIQNNIFDGNGVSSMSLSMGGVDGNKLKRVVIKDNQFVNIGALSYNASDSLDGRLKYEFTALHEFWNFEDFNISGNYFKNSSFSFSGFAKGIFANNVISDSTFLNGAIFTFSDTMKRMVFSNNSIFGNKNQGQIFRFNGALRQSRITENSMHFDDDGNRNIFSFQGSYANQFNGVTISENTIEGFVYILFSSNIGLNYVKNCYIRGNDFSATNIARAGMFPNNSQSVGFYIKDNSFTGGNIESDSINNNAATAIRQEFKATADGQSNFVTSSSISKVADFFLNGIPISSTKISFDGQTVIYGGEGKIKVGDDIYINYYNQQ